MCVVVFGCAHMCVRFTFELMMVDGVRHFNFISSFSWHCFFRNGFLFLDSLRSSVHHVVLGWCWARWLDVLVFEQSDSVQSFIHLIALNLICMWIRNNVENVAAFDVLINTRIFKVITKLLLSTVSNLMLHITCE